MSADSGLTFVLANMRTQWPKFREILLLLLLLTAATGYRWIALSGEAAPPGSDGGNWLAFGAELFDERVKAAAAAYPPIFPLLVHGFVVVLSPLVALKILGLLSGAVVSIGAYLLLRQALPWGLAGILATVLSLADYQTEVLAWGGYPQLLGAALLLVAVFLLLQGLHTGKFKYFMWSALAGAFTVATHLLGAYQFLLTTVIAMAAYYYGWKPYLTQNESGIRRRLVVLWIAVTMILTLATLPFYVRMISYWAGIPANPHGLNLVRFLENIGSWRTESYMWLAVAVVVIPVLVWSVYRRERMLLAEGALALVGAALFGLIIQNEVRSIHMLQVGLVLSVGVALARMLGSHTQLILRTVRLGAPHAAIALAIIFVGTVGFFGDQRSNVAFDWYRVIDDEALEGLEWMRIRGEKENRVVANETPRGGIYGWWVEGYAGLPTYFAVDTRWLSFREEKDQAEVAHRMLSADISALEMSRLAEANRIKFLFLDKRTLLIPQGRLEKAGFELGLENELIQVFVYNAGG